ncbi:MAG TPA: histidine kinase, partial [Verrucomicrobiae bacterium]|nr:histidine kinase [Verrucomicrobiae bacterium]
GPAHAIADAEALLAGERPHCALLDANVAGHSSVELGAKLAEMGVPLAFCTGYDEIKNLPPSLAQAPLMTKPISDAELQAGLSKLLG